MNTRKKRFTLFGDERKGASLIEYGSLVGLIAVVAIGAVTSLGGEIRSVFATTASELALAVAGTSGAAGSAGATAPEHVFNPLADASCYDPSNIGTIGTAAGCKNMLIVSSAMMQAKKATPYGGDGAFAFLHPNGTTYTFARDGNDIFTGQVTDFSFLFHSATFNGDISYCDTSSATTMRKMFWAASNFDGDLSGWRTDTVQDMNGMFGNATAFTGSTTHWNTDNVTDMGRMFMNAVSFNEDLSGWCVTNIGAEPASFDSSAVAWTDQDHRPIWGSCPSN